MPPGATGLKLTPARVARNVTAVLTGDGLAGEGEGVMVMVGFSLVTVTLAVLVPMA